MRLAGRLAVALAATTHDWAPAGLELSDLLLVSCTGTVHVTGLAAQGRERVVVVQCVAGTLVLDNANVGSAAANRFALDADLTLPAGTGATLFYDQSAGAWRAIRTSTGGTGSTISLEDVLAIEALA